MKVPLHCIDACVFLEFIIQKSNRSKNVISLLGYRKRNKGLITHLIIGEIVVSIILKIKNQEARLEAFRLLEITLHEGVKEGKLAIAPIQHMDDFYCEELIEKYQMTPDDSKHISQAIINRCSTFVTLDTQLTNRVTVRKLRKEYGIKITEP